ncbi:MAG: hypothetical protein LJE91_07735 [Gammaproteobacteria bacterium]|jgi:hypothetical protein|nr:hypothetical protein [Gammaproteobacteria bacterium]
MNPYQMPWSMLPFAVAVIVTGAMLYMPLFMVPTFLTAVAPEGPPILVEASPDRIAERRMR